MKSVNTTLALIATALLLSACAKKEEPVATPAAEPTPAPAEAAPAATDAMPADATAAPADGAAAPADGAAAPADAAAPPADAAAAGNAEDASQSGGDKVKPQ